MGIGDFKAEQFLSRACRDNQEFDLDVPYRQTGIYAVPGPKNDRWKIKFIAHVWSPVNGFEYKILFDATGPNGKEYNKLYATIKDDMFTMDSFIDVMREALINSIYAEMDKK